MKRIFLFLLVACALSWGIILRTDGFSFSLIQAPLLQGDCDPISPEAQKALDQPFFYLNKGRQSFVFESRDGKYVLKFFNKKYFQMPWYGFIMEKAERAKREKRRHFYENSYSIAYREMGEEILYLHLRDAKPLPTIQITDKVGRKIPLNLEKIPFVLQRKGLPFYEVLNHIYQKEGKEGLCREIDRFLAAISLRISKNIADGDHDVEHNWGYVDGHIFHLDPGRLYHDELSDPVRRKGEWENGTRDFHKWLKKNYPECVDYFDLKIKST